MYVFARNRSLREDIHSKYWELPYAKQRDWLFAKTTSKNPDRIRIRGDVRQRKRSYTIHYSLPNKGEDLKVCQRFFLSTLGYSGDSVIKALVAQLIPTKISPPVCIYEGTKVHPQIAAGDERRNKGSYQYV